MNKRQKILIVDDAKFNRDILKEFLGETYDYLEAENGNQAVQIMEENPGIDLMLLDINMPQMDGFEVLKWMKLSQCIEETPVIMISSEESVETMRKAYEMGITDYITRPFDSVIVKKRVQNTLGLYANQKRLINVVVDQVYEKEENNRLKEYIHVLEEAVIRVCASYGIEAGRVKGATGVWRREHRDGWQTPTPAGLVPSCWRNNIRDIWLPPADLSSGS